MSNVEGWGVQRCPENWEWAYSPGSVVVEGMNERCMGHMMMLLLDAEEAVAWRLLAVVVERSEDNVTGWRSWTDGH